MESYVKIFVDILFTFHTFTGLVGWLLSKEMGLAAHGLVGLLQFDVERFFCLQTRRNNEIFCLITFAPLVGLKFKFPRALLFTLAILLTLQLLLLLLVKWIGMPFG